VRPPEAWKHVYPWPLDVLERIAYTFRYEHERGLVRAALVRRLCRDVASWRQLAPVHLRFVVLGDARAYVEERRSDECSRRVDLDELDTLLYTACDEIAPEDDLVQSTRAYLRTRGEANDEREARSQVLERLNRLIEAKIMVEVHGRYLALASTTPKAPTGQL